MTAYVTMKEMHTNLKKVQRLVEEWNDVIVMKHSKPYLNITKFNEKKIEEPKLRIIPWKKYTIHDIDNFTFEWDPKNWDNLSEMIDKYVYFG